MSVAQIDLAVLLGNQGHYPESTEVARQALDSAQQYFPANHPYVLMAEQTYAMALLNQHKPQEVEAIQRDIIARSTRINGPEARDTLISHIQLGETLIDLGRFEEAKTLLQSTAEVLDRVEGSDNRYATGAWADYSVAACSSRDIPAGLAAAQRVVAIRARALAADDFRLMGARADVGLGLVRLHRYPEAEPLLLQAAASLEAARGPGFYTTQFAYKTLRELYQGENQPLEAARFAARSPTDRPSQRQRRLSPSKASSSIPTHAPRRPRTQFMVGTRRGRGMLVRHEPCSLSNGSRSGR